MHPQMAQPGAASGRPPKAKSAMVAQFAPAKKGRKVVLLKKKGRKWVTVATTKQNAKGRAQFTAPYKIKGKLQSYRVQAVQTRAEEDRQQAEGPTSGRRPTERLSSKGTSLPADWAHRRGYDGLRHCAVANPETSPWRPARCGSR